MVESQSYERSLFSLSLPSSLLAFWLLSNFCVGCVVVELSTICEVWWLGEFV